jgi:nicotinamide riboside kinase
MLRVALLGAESTGKTRLAGELAAALTKAGLRCTVVPEYLREWCDRQGRTPQREEQAEIARIQSLRIAQAPPADLLIADTTALVTAVYSELLFGDTSLFEMAWACQAGFDLTLLTGTDLPWQADGHQRSSPEKRDAFDAALRRALDRGHVRYQVIYGQGEERLAQALAILRACGRLPSLAIQGQNQEHAERDAEPLARWHWSCEKCSDPQCEHRLFSERLRWKAAGPGRA